MKTVFDNHTHSWTDIPMFVQW